MIGAGEFHPVTYVTWRMLCFRFSPATSHDEQLWLLLVYLISSSLLGNHGNTLLMYHQASISGVMKREKHLVFGNLTICFPLLLSSVWLALMHMLPTSVRFARLKHSQTLMKYSPSQSLIFTFCIYRCKSKHHCKVPFQKIAQLI